MSASPFAKLFDHSMIRPDATRDEVRRFAETAVRLQTATLTVQPYYVPFAASILRGSGVLVGTVIGFPHGAETTAIKVYAARHVIESGAEEIDMVMNIGALKNGERDAFVHDVSGVVEAARPAKVKVITENCLLSDDEKRRACVWIADAGAAFVKTATAYAAGGATVADVRLMREAVAGRCQVKAAGGVRQIGEVLEYLRAGATRFGSTRSDALVAAYEALPASEQAAFAPHLPAPTAV
jgi:deoxyribose-phosphate aldolase